jgi:hypothetical protein
VATARSAVAPESLAFEREQFVAQLGRLREPLTNLELVGIDAPVAIAMSSDYEGVSPRTGSTNEDVVLRFSNVDDRCHRMYL